MSSDRDVSVVSFLKRSTLAPGVERSRQWERQYRNRQIAIDTVLVVAVLGVSYVIQWGFRRASVGIWLTENLRLEVDYWVLFGVLTVGWLLGLGLVGAWDPHVLGSGATEYSRVERATLYTFGIFAMLALTLRILPSRTFVSIAFVSGMIVLPLGRWVSRQWLGRQRTHGKYVHQVVLFGPRDKCVHVANQIGPRGRDGYLIIGAVMSGGDCCDDVASWLPTLGTGNPVGLASEAGADTIILTGSQDLDPQAMQQLGWQLDEYGIALVVAPSLTDIAGPRLHTRAVAGLPLIHIAYPQMSGFPRLLKRTLDIVISALALLLGSPVFVAVAIAVKVSSPGPILFKQERIGMAGKPFTMLKFRSMVVNADQVPLPDDPGLEASARDSQKMRGDPRVTKVGAFIRKFSLDELPQFINVLKGDMSLVGPRPQVMREVLQYDRYTYRRLMIKPGITGLWQVSGRSDLSWDDSIRLDLYYVENWTIAWDIVILWRTIKVVMRADGAF